MNRKKIPKPPDTSTHIQFRMVVTDTNKLDNRTTYTFFNDTDDYSDERAILIPEQKMMEWFFNNPHALGILCDELDLSPDYMWFLGVTHPIIKYVNRKPGDIDALLCHKTDPRKAIAFECKKVKIRFNETKEAVLNKVESLKKGIEQVNALSKIGFHKCYLFVIIVTDGINLHDDNQIFKRASTKDLNRVYNFNGYKNLESNVGIILCLVTQLSGKALDMNNAVAIREHKIAHSQEQPSELNENILSYLKEKT